MHRNSLLAIATLFSSIACVTGDPSATDPNLAPAMSAEDQEVLSKLEANKLADVEVAGGKVTFYETEPGEFFAKSEFPIGAAMPALPTGASLADAFHAVAPGQAIPERMQQAIDRERTTEHGSEVAPVSAVVPTSNLGAKLERTTLQSNVASSVEEEKQGALVSVIDWTWFNNNYCKGYSGPFALTWCYAAAYNNAYARGNIHFSNTIACADTGSARLRMKRSGSTLHVADFAYGTCSGWWFHGGHDIFGGALTRTIEYIVENPQQSVRFAGYMKSSDSFNAVPPGF